MDLNLNLRDLMAQRLARRAEDREAPVPVPPKTNFSRGIEEIRWKIRKDRGDSIKNKEG